MNDFWVERLHGLLIDKEDYKVVELTLNWDKYQYDQHVHVVFGYKKDIYSKVNNLVEFDVDHLYEAVAYGILFHPIDNYYKQTPESEFYKIIISEGRDKCGYICYKIFVNNEWKVDFTECASSIGHALSIVTNRFYKMSSIPYYLNYRNNPEPSFQDYPMFKYDGFYYRSTHYIPEQKCMCGESWRGRRPPTKVEVWDAYFYRKNTLYVFKNGYIYNEFIRDKIRGLHPKLCKYNLNQHNLLLEECKEYFFDIESIDIFNKDETLPMESK